MEPSNSSRKSSSESTKKLKVGDDVSSFCSIMVGGFSSRLLLPSQLCHRLKYKVGRRAYLKDCNDQIWNVKLSKFNARFAFQEGWHDFVNDHSITFGDFLLFQHTTGSHFDVLIFGRDCLERKIFPTRGCNGEPHGQQFEMKKEYVDFVSHIDERDAAGSREKNAEDGKECPDDSKKSSSIPNFGKSSSSRTT